MSDCPEPIWRKELKPYVLLEYPKAPHYLNCSIHYKDERLEETFCFGGWGMEREAITRNMCFVCCQAFLNADLFGYFGTFKDALDSIKTKTFFVFDGIEDEEDFEDTWDE